MTKYLIILTVLVLIASGCATAVEELPDASELLAHPTTAESARTVISPAADRETPATTPEQTAAKATGAGAPSPSAGETEESGPAAGQPVEPVTVDLGRITPQPDKAGDQVVQPAPGIPRPAARLVRDVAVDLSDRLDIDIGEIELVEVEEVTWRDSSLGCPQPGMNYLTVLTDGYRIVLEAQGDRFFYHTRDTSFFVLCTRGKPYTDTKMKPADSRHESM